MHERFEEQIRTDPADPGGWLVYADWLTERGDARGELIRLEHRLERQPMPTQERRRVLQRARELRQAHEQRWLDAHPTPSGVQLQWHSGFIVGMTWTTWWGSRPELELLEAIVTDPIGRLFARLCVRSHLGARGVEALAASPGLARVRELVLADVGLDTRYRIDGQLAPGSLGVLLASPHLTDLRALDLSDNALAEQAQALAGLPVLEALRLRGCRLGDEGVAVIARAQPLAGLTTLELGSNALGPDGAATLAASPTLRALRSLSLRDNPIGAQGIAALAASPILQGLQQLDLSHTDARGEPAGGDVGLLLARSAHLGSLVELNLRGVSLSEAGITALTSPDGLSGCRIIR